MKIFNVDKRYKFGVYTKKATDTDDIESLQKTGTATLGGSVLNNLGIFNTDDYFQKNPHKFSTDKTIGIFEIDDDTGIATYFDASNPTPMLPATIGDNANTEKGIDLHNQFAGDKLYDKLYNMNEKVALKFEAEIKAVQNENNTLRIENADLKSKMNLINELGGMTNVFDALNFYKEYGNGNAQKLSDKVKMESGQQWKENAMMKGFDIAGRLAETILNNTTNNPDIQHTLNDVMQRAADKFFPKVSNNNSTQSENKDEFPTE